MHRLPAFFPILFLVSCALETPTEPEFHNENDPATMEYSNAQSALQEILTYSNKVIVGMTWSCAPWIGFIPPDTYQKITSFSYTTYATFTNGRWTIDLDSWFGSLNNNTSALALIYIHPADYNNNFTMRLREIYTGSSNFPSNFCYGRVIKDQRTDPVVITDTNQVTNYLLYGTSNELGGYQMRVFHGDPILIFTLE